MSKQFYTFTKISCPQQDLGGKRLCLRRMLGIALKELVHWSGMHKLGICVGDL